MNLITGPNGAGKTSLLEAVYALLRQKSFRSNLNNELVRWGCDSTMVVARIQDAADEPLHLLGFRRSRAAGVELKLDGAPVQQRSELVSRFPLCSITPASTVLVSGGPGERREFLDQTLFHVEPRFLPIWRGYRAALNQRNALLRSGSLRGLEVWDQQLVKFGELLDKQRQQLVVALEQPLNDALARLEQPWVVDVAYRRGWGDESLQAALDEVRAGDLRRTMTSRGPHRAELKLVSQSKPATESLSRGQQRILAIALYAAQQRLIAESTGKSPLILVDDIGAELDHINANKVIDLLASFGGQVLVTALTPEPYLVGHRITSVFHVEH